MQELPIVIHSTPWWKNSLYIPLKFIVSLLTIKAVNTTMIIDSGAQINCIDWAFIWWNRIPTRPLANPFHIHNIDQTSNIICQYEAVVCVQLGNVTQKIHFYIINGGKENAILGNPWLEAVNPTINWKKGIVTIPSSKDQTLVLSFSHLADCASYLSKNTCPAATPTVNPQQETTLDPIEQTGLCWYLSAKLPKHFMEHVVDSFIINCIQKCRSHFITPLATATLNKLTM